MVTEIPKFKNSKIPRFKKSSQTFGISKIWSFLGILGFWNLGILEFQKFQKFDCCFVEFWIFGFLDFWNSGILDFWIFLCLDFLEFWNLRILDFCSLKGWSSLGGLAYTYISYCKLVSDCKDKSLILAPAFLCIEGPEIGCESEG